MLPILPKSHPPEQNWAASGTSKIRVNPTQIHPVCNSLKNLIYFQNITQKRVGRGKIMPEATIVLFPSRRCAHRNAATARSLQPTKSPQAPPLRARSHEQSWGVAWRQLYKNGSSRKIDSQRLQGVPRLVCQL